MAKWFTFFIFSLILLSSAEARSLLNNTSPHSDSQGSISPSHEQSLINDDDGEDGCKGLGKEECLARKTMLAHTDYIYTQDIHGP
ncbi:hypothetical protein L6164_001845 [Bauhinia variegata]|uniref:Uncharacterized protein n=1 Tax=Bauhinia variegata TaxID=167791 RepID=A0ACB9QA16_BAUVA|nr:hypothetical protein L6164_001845 [Bauhinia variegata]